MAQTSSFEAAIYTKKQQGQTILCEIIDSIFAAQNKVCWWQSSGISIDLIFNDDAGYAVD